MTFSSAARSKIEFQSSLGRSIIVGELRRRVGELRRRVGGSTVIVVIQLPVHRRPQRLLGCRVSQKCAKYIYEMVF